MSITSTNIFRSLLFIGVCFFLAIPSFAAAYGQSYYYGQGYYYGQAYYQGSYVTTFTKNTAESLNFTVTGAISKGSGTFVIDHPLDPINKLLYHSFVESPDVKNLYDGVIALNGKGEATVKLPAYYDALNIDTRYQLKPIGASMPDLYVKEEEKNNQFTIGGGVAGGKVSWQVTGIRHDPYILANPIIPEVQKGVGQLVNKGEYLFPDGYPSNVFTLKFGAGYKYAWDTSALADTSSPTIVTFIQTYISPLFRKQ